MKEKIPEAEIKAVENAEWMYVEHPHGEYTLFYRSIYVGGKFDKDQLEALVYLANSYDLSLYMFIDEDGGINAKLK